MLFKPFTFLKQKVAAAPPAPTWTPDDFSNVQYWWRADLGITTDGNGVTIWEDQINGYDLVDPQGVTSGTNPAATTSSNMNDQAVISFNGTTDFMYTLSTPAALSSRDVTILMVYEMIDTKTGGMTMGITYLGNNTRFYMDVSGGNQRVLSENIGSSGLLVTTIESPATTGPQAFKLRYDASAGDGFYAQNTLTETANGTSGDINTTWRADSTVAMGALVRNTAGEVFGGRYVEYKVAEEVVIYGTPSSTEMDDWKAYVNTRYGTIIS